MDLTSVLGSILGGGKKTQNQGGIDLGSILKQVAGGSSNNTASSKGLDVGNILKQMAGNNSSDLISVILKQVVASGLGGMMGNAAANANQPAANGSNPLGNMSKTDIASAAQNAAVILKSILGNKQ